MPDLKTEGRIIRRLISIDPCHLIVSVGENSRQYSELDIDEMAQSLLVRGQEQPVKVRRLEKGPVGKTEERLQLVFGYRRYFGATRINEKGLTGPARPDTSVPFELQCVVTDQDEEDAFLSNLTENGNRLDLTPPDYAKVIRRLETEFLKSREQIAQILHKSAGWISETLSILELPDWFQERVAKREIAASSAYDVARVPEPERLKLLSSLQKNGKPVTRTMIQDFLEKLQAEPKEVMSDDPERITDRETRAHAGHATPAVSGVPAQGVLTPRQGRLDDVPRDKTDGFNVQEPATEGDRATAHAAHTPPPSQKPEKGRAPKPVKGPKLRARTTKETRDALATAAEDEGKPANLRELCKTLVQFIDRKIGDRAFYSKCEMLLKSRPVQ